MPPEKDHDLNQCKYQGFFQENAVDLTVAIKGTLLLTRFISEHYGEPTVGS